MALKLLVFVVATLLLVSTKASAKGDEEYTTEKVISVPAPALAPAVPVKAPAPAVPVKAPTPAPLVKPPTAAAAPKVATPPSPVSPPTKPLPKIRTIADCVPLCGERCKAHSRKNVCQRACNTCCVRCKCVPPGTYGNREMCGTCYTGMMSRNRPKCP